MTLKTWYSSDLFRIFNSKKLPPNREKSHQACAEIEGRAEELWEILSFFGDGNF